MATNKAFSMSDFHVFPGLKISGNFRGHCSHEIMLLLVTHRWNRRALCLSIVTQSFRTFLGYAFTYLYEIWFTWRVSHQVRLSSRLIYFFMSYCPSKFVFRTFKWNLVASSLYQKLQFKFDFCHDWLAFSGVIALLAILSVSFIPCCICVYAKGTNCSSG